MSGRSNEVGIGGPLTHDNNPRLTRGMDAIIAQKTTLMALGENWYLAEVYHCSRCGCGIDLSLCPDYAVYV
jgi:hypothetical protein